MRVWHEQRGRGAHEGVAGREGVDVGALRIGWCYKYVGAKRSIYQNMLLQSYLHLHVGPSFSTTDGDVMMVVV